MNLKHSRFTMTGSIIASFKKENRVKARVKTLLMWDRERGRASWGGVQLISESWKHPCNCRSIQIHMLIDLPAGFTAGKRMHVFEYCVLGKLFFNQYFKLCVTWLADGRFLGSHCSRSLISWMASELALGIRVARLVGTHCGQRKFMEAASWHPSGQSFW